MALSAEADESNRVVVTGLGVISGCGIGADAFFDAIVEGKSSIDRVKRFDAQYMPCQIASEVPDEMFNANDHFVNPKNAKSNDRYTHFAVAAARQALKDAGLGDTPETLKNPERVGVMVGSAFGGIETSEQQTLKLASNPERPKVSRGHTSQLQGIFLTLVWLRFDLGFAFYHSSTIGKYCIGSNRHRMWMQGT